MKLTRELEAEIKQVMDDYWASYLRGDLETYAAFLVPDYKNIGTTREEIWDSKDEIMSYTRGVISQMVGQAEMRNKEVRMYVMDPYIMVHEFGDMYIKTNEEWKLYAEFRLSSVLKKIDGAWMVLHQHGSYPDSRTQEGEAFAFDELLAENKKLQKAVLSRTHELERKNRELEIEASLERIRAAGMAMHHTSELQKVINTVAQQLHLLELDINGGVFISINEDIDELWCIWGASGVTDYVNKTCVPFLDRPIYTGLVRAIKDRQGFLIEEFSREEKIEFFEFLFKHPPFNATSAERQKELLSRTGGYSRSVSISENTTVIMINHFGKGFSDSENSVLARVAKVFEQTYVRFLDVQKAEAQAREAHIETALERVRSKAMAMQHSDELADLVSKVFQEMTQLDIMLTRCIIWIFDPEDLSARLWMANQEAETGAENYLLPSHNHPTYQAFLKAWQDRESKWVYDLHGNLKTTWDELLFTETEFARLPDEVKAGMKAPDRISLSASFNNFGALQTAGLEPLSDEYLDILNRFGRVFDLTYTRFHDLQQAEKQTQQAQAEAALERVRARALAMQEPEELTEVASVLWQEMGMLGAEELETSSIYINDQAVDKAKCWFALKDIREKTSTLVSDHIELDLNDTWVGREMLKFYRTEDNQVSIVMTGDHRKEWIHYCEERSPAFRGYYGEVIPDRTYHLYKFSHGAVAAAAAGDISEESWDLLQRTASVFSLAYSRFKDLTQARIDLQHLVEEKSRAEEALKELKSTQAQLIHAEKMASLGELTAGIAHEIQNPLNFVNNFSEVSQELLEEMEAELNAGNTDEVGELARDVVQNLEKITTHGRRADAIVKSMLQHSRTTAGTKEPTDLNELVDEFLRLAYHGLRAKNKSFNADFQTKLDDSLPKVDVIAQDLGRVLLNLINNAFYAVTEKKLTTDNYKPTVTASTINLGDKIEIRVKDNGNGIPQDALGKIFQPFFTTKPTGEGTGLGLSLSYDIIRAHGGELQVESVNGIGTEMIIRLPVK